MRQASCVSDCLIPAEDSSAVAFTAMGGSQSLDRTELLQCATVREGHRTARKADAQAGHSSGVSLRATVMHYGNDHGWGYSADRCTET
jgi:hypothetical protein